MNLDFWRPSVFARTGLKLPIKPKFSRAISKRLLVLRSQAVQTIIKELILHDNQQSVSAVSFGLKHKRVKDGK
jgi:hypothetical protein